MKGSDFRIEQRAKLTEFYGIGCYDFEYFWKAVDGSEKAEGMWIMGMGEGYNIFNMKTSKNLSYFTTQIINNIVINNVNQNCNNLFLPISPGLLGVLQLERAWRQVHQLYFCGGFD